MGIDMGSSDRPIISSSSLWWTALILVCLTAGSVSLLVDPLLVMGVLLVLANMVLIVKFPFYGLLLYLLVFLMRPGEVFPILASLRIELLLGGFVLVSIISHQLIKVGKVTIPKDRVTIGLILLTGALALSIFTSFEVTQTKDTVLEFAKTTVLYLLVVSLLTTRKRFVIFVTVFILLIAYIAYDALFNYLAGQFIHTMNVDRLTGTTSAGGDPNTLATTIVTAIPLFVATMYYFRNWVIRAAVGLTTVSLLYLLVITASRGGLMAFVGIVLAAVLFTRHRVALVLTVLVLSAVTWQVMPDQYRTRYMEFSETGENINHVSSGRWEIWQAGLQMIVARPVLGVGAGAFPWAYASGNFGPPKFMEPHNIYIQVLATTGIVGTAIWVFFLSELFKVLRRIAAEVRRRPEIAWALTYRNGLLLVLVGLFVAGMFGHSLFRYTWYIAAAMTVALEGIIGHAEDQEGHVETLSRSTDGAAVERT
jgi:putative inorganic carbon (hco3(-)) transporter